MMSNIVQKQLVLSQRCWLISSVEEPRQSEKIVLTDSANPIVARAGTY